MKLRIISGLTTLLFTVPIWFYLLYKILQGVNASELMWFLFWVYVPFTLFVHMVTKVMEKKE